MTLGRNTYVAVGYTSAYSDALVARAGAGLTVESRTSEYPGWVWCRDSPGNGAWVPEALLEISGDVALLTADYDSTELSVLPGDEVEVLSEVAGWAWCGHVDGRRGWIPAENLGEPSGGGGGADRTVASRHGSHRGQH